jgi:hypothetical protein
VTLEIVAIGLTLVAHVVGAGVLVWNLLDGEGFDWHVLWPRDDDGGGGGWPEPPAEPDPGTGPITVTTPVLPDAAPSAVRLREPGRIGDGYPRTPRRPDHVPERPPVPARDA